MRHVNTSMHRASLVEEDEARHKRHREEVRQCGAIPDQGCAADFCAQGDGCPEPADSNVGVWLGLWSVALVAIGAFVALVWA